MIVAYRIGFKSKAGYPILLNNLGFPNEELARAEARKQTEAGNGKHYVFKVTTEEVG